MKNNDAVAPIVVVFIIILLIAIGIATLCILNGTFNFNQNQKSSSINVSNNLATNSPTTQLQDNSAISASLFITSTSEFGQLFKNDGDIILSYNKQYPNIVIKTVISNSRGSIVSVEQGLCDIGISSTTPTVTDGSDLKIFQIGHMDNSDSSEKELIIVTKGNPSTITQTLIDFLSSTEGQQLLLKNGITSQYRTITPAPTQLPKTTPTVKPTVVYQPTLKPTIAKYPTYNPTIMPTSTVPRITLENGYYTCNDAHDVFLYIGSDGILKAYATLSDGSLDYEYGLYSISGKILTYTLSRSVINGKDLPLDNPKISTLTISDSTTLLTNGFTYRYYGINFPIPVHTVTPTSNPKPKATYTVLFIPASQGSISGSLTSTSTGASMPYRIVQDGIQFYNVPAGYYDWAIRVRGTNPDGSSSTSTYHSQMSLYVNQDIIENLN